MSTALLSTTYFGPIQWYQKLNRYDTCLIEQHDHFLKQTYRNRCVIATTQGLQALTVPIESPQGQRIDKTEVKDVRISDHGDWRHLHWQALQSAYGESPFFEFYADDLYPFFEKRWEYLLDFNMAITEKMCELIDIQPKIKLTTEFITPTEEASGTMEEANTTVVECDEQKDSIADFRSVIRPKHPLPDPTFTSTLYYQVYKEKYGFQPNLSILDLLFNMGNEAVLYL